MYQGLDFGMVLDGHVLGSGADFSSPCANKDSQPESLNGGQTMEPAVAVVTVGRP